MYHIKMCLFRTHTYHIDFIRSQNVHTANYHRQCAVVNKKITAYKIHCTYRNIYITVFTVIWKDARATGKKKKTSNKWQALFPRPDRLHATQM